jgi:protein-disulfide isomerase
MRDTSSERNECARPRPARRAHRAWMRAGVAALVLGVTACRDAASRPEEASVTAVSEAIGLYAGIPQDGIVLGDPSAPVTLTEFADLKCHHCRNFALRVLPALIERHVRTKQARIVFRNLAFLSPESMKAARAAAALGLQDHLWEFIDLFFRSQREPGSAEVTDDFLRRIAAMLPGVDAERALSERDSAAALRQLAEAEQEAKSFHIPGTPAFLLGRTGEAPSVLRISSMTPEAFSRAIDDLLQQTNAAPVPLR